MKHKILDEFRKVRKNEKLLFIFVLLLLSLIPLTTWFKDEYLLMAGDFFPPLNPYRIISICRFIWDQHMGGGILFPTKLFPFFSFFAFFKFLGVDMLITGRLWFILVFLFPGLSMYYLASILTPEKKYKIGRFIAALFYMFNVSILNPLSDAPILAYIFTPLLLGIFAKGLEKKENKYIILFGLSSLLLATSAANIPIYLLVCSVIGIYFTYYCISRLGKREVLSNLFFLMKIITLCIFINLWWIVPYFVSFVSPGGGDITISSDINIDWVRWTSKNSNFLNVFRLLGKWSMGDGVGGFLYYPYLTSYFSPLLITTTYIITILAFSALLLKPRDKRVWFFTFLAIVSIFLSKGLHSPLEFIYKFLYLHIPGFFIFREPFAKFIPVVALSYAVLIGISTSKIYNSFSGKRKKWIGLNTHKVFIIFVIFIILVSAWPIITGDNIPQKRGPLPSAHVKIPSYWFKASEWINNETGDFRVFLSPQNLFYAIHYNWGYYGKDITPELLHKPIITITPGGGYLESKRYNQIVVSTYKLIQSNSTENLTKFLGLFNVKYIVQRNDLDWTGLNNPDRTVSSPDHIKSVLTFQKNIHLEKSFGELDLYKISDDYFLSHIYVSPDKTGL